MADAYVDAIRFEEADGLKSIVLKACQCDAELIITRQPDGEISFAATEGSRQLDFAIISGELGALSLRWLGLSSIQAQPAPAESANWDAQAYATMRDEIEYWKRKAAESDEALERIRNDLAPTHMGEPVTAAPATRSAQRIVQQTENIAELLAHVFHGSFLASGATYRESESPKAQQCWKVACQIQDELTSTDVENAVAELEEAQPAPDFCDKHCTWTDHHPDCERHTGQGEDA